MTRVGNYDTRATRGTPKQFSVAANDITNSEPIATTIQRRYLVVSKLITRNIPINNKNLKKQKF